MRGGGSERRKKTERASWIVFVLFEKQRYDLFSWGLVLFLTFASQNRIRQAKIRKGSISGANCTIIYIPISTCVVLEDKVRPSIRIRSRSCSSPLNLPLPYRDSWQIDWRFLIATWNGIIKRVSFHCTHRARFVLDRRAELKNSSDYFGSLRITGWRDTVPDTHRSEFLRACDARCKICNNDNKKDLGHSPVLKIGMAACLLIASHSYHFYFLRDTRHVDNMSLSCGILFAYAQRYGHILS